MSCLMLIESYTSKVWSTALMTTSLNRCRYHNNFITIIILIFNIIASPLSSSSSSSSRLPSTPSSFSKGGISSVYLWDQDDGFAGCFLIKKSELTVISSIVIVTYSTVMMSTITLLFITPCNHYTLSSATILLLPLTSSYSF